MLPFLKPKRQDGVIVAQRKPNGNIDMDLDKNMDDESIDYCSQDLLDGINSKDIKKISSALKSAFEILDSQPHEEGPHTYEAQNIKAAKERE